MAVDILVRNYSDVYIFVGLFWAVSCNGYLISSLNVTFDIINDLQKVLIKTLLAVNATSLVTLIVLKSVHL